MTSEKFVALTWGRPARLCFVLGLAIVASTFGAVNALATDADIVNANGFEPGVAPNGFSTTYTAPVTGQLEGQINPPGFAQVISPGAWLRTLGPGTSTAVVQNTVFAPGGGTQSVRVARGANSNDFWAVPANNQGYPDFPNPAAPEPAQQFICISWSMRVEQSTGPANSFGPFFGVQAFDDDGNTVGTLAALYVDSRNGEVLFSKAVTGNATAPVSNPVVTLTAPATPATSGWRNYAIELDYNLKQYKYFLDGLLLGTEAFVDQAAAPGGLNQFSDATIMAVSGGGDVGSQNSVGTAWFDNFVVREGQCAVIPEPATAVLGMLGLFGIASVRRKRRS